MTGNSPRFLAVVFISALALVVSIFGPALAHPGQHGPTEGHLIGDGAWGDLELISSLRLTDTPGIVADVAISPDGNWAYLAHWGRPECAANSEAGGQNNPDAGAWVVDISDLENPLMTGFIPHHQDSRPGEGMQVVTLDTKFFSGDLLVMNSEQCGKNGKGGIVLWDVSNPLKPMRVSSHFGDRGFADTRQIHSAWAWQAGDQAYAVIVDNEEWPDVDILDITNPKRPRVIAEYDLREFDVAQPEIGLTQQETFLHDMTVKEIDGRFIMLASYWDGGWVLLDVTDPADAQFLGDTDYEAIDPLLLERTGLVMPPEGNAHQAEWTVDNRFFISTDEDFAPYAVGDFQITTGPNAGIYASTTIGGADPVTALPDRRLNGPTAYVGYACPDSDPVPPRDSVGLPPLAPGEEAIAVVQRGPVGDPSATEGACFPGEKAERIMAAGYDAMVFVDHHAGHAADADVPFCGSGAFTHHVAPFNVAVCTTHTAFHHLFDSTPDFSQPYVPANEPAIGDVGQYVDVDALFDGWGYVHLFDADTLTDLDQYAIPEAHDEDFSIGFGDLTVHEVATHPTEWNRAYLSYYAGGMRSLEIQCSDPSDTSTCELVETGGYLDPNGNDFWGVEVFVRDGETIVFGSDRDSGLWIFRDTSLGG